MKTTIIASQSYPVHGAARGRHNQGRGSFSALGAVPERRLLDDDVHKQLLLEACTSNLGSTSCMSGRGSTTMCASKNEAGLLWPRHMTRPTADHGRWNMASAGKDEANSGLSGQGRG